MEDGEGSDGRWRRRQWRMGRMMMEDGEDSKMEGGEGDDGGREGQ